MPQQVQETATITEAAAAAAKKTGRMLVQFISPGWGSSGYYSPEVLEQAVADQVVPAGTHMYADHPTETENIERPVRSIKDLMSVTTGPSRLATEADVTEWGADLGAVVGEVQVVPQWRDLVEAVKDSIGVSLRGGGTAEVGEAEGRSGMIFESLTAPVLSVDWVTRAGRGGKVLSVLESAAANRRAIGHGISEATVNDTREALQTALRDAYGTERVGQTAATYVWVRDFDDSKVWFEVDGPGADSGLYQQTYTQNDGGAVALSGDRTEVRVRTTYVPVARPGSTTTEESEEDTMPETRIEETELARLREDAGRVETLESERDTAARERDEARSELAVERRTSRARALISEADATFTPLEQRGLLADLPIAEDGTLDEDAFGTRLSEAAAEAQQRAGAGRVSGFGGSATDSGDQQVSESDIDTAVAGAFGRTIKEA